ncbi:MULTISPECIES: sensor domain-containing protein [Legionella]|uniref:Putative regulatory protein (GGDEF domain) n=1 Tax=Legionella drozanskii LLAP-1 TaxID=1212489 RepID=A0A0W0TD30_9GAMM|nr:MULTISPECIES: PAS domain S-box protein [Legionella]KTC93157.1 putative regulatory protein (GGDEF domain) [Legionella drozanskii LLAP-1]
MEKIPFKSVLDQTDDVVIITGVEPIDDPFGPKILYVNQSFTKITGYKQEEVLGKTPRILQGEKTDKPTLQRIRSALEKKEAIHVELLNYTKDQTEYWLDFTIVPIKDSKGDIKYFAAIEHDITERKKLEDAQAMLSSLVEFSGEAIIGKNLEGTIQSWNKAAGNLYGYSEKEAIGANIKMLFPKGRLEEFQNIIHKIAKGEHIKNFETLRIHKDGHSIPVSITIGPIKNTQGKVIGASTTARDITQQKIIEEKLKHLAEHDVLTGLINRPLFEDRLVQALAVAKRMKCYMAVCFLDIDGFKNINDSYGHHIGDLLLCAAAKCMQKCIREVDTLARFGGDEFALILSYLKEENEVIKIMKELIRLFSKGFLIENHNLRVTLSIGISLYPKDGMHDLLKKADAAMYYVKKHGKNSYNFWSPIGC